MGFRFIRNPFRWLIPCVLWLSAPTVFAADDIRVERVQFKKGASGAVIEASIKGYETVDYVLGARAGQTMTVTLDTRHGATYFNLLAPGESVVALFNASHGDNRYEGALPASGDYTVRVYMMRSAARRNEVAKYRLEVRIGGAAHAAAPAPSHDARVPGTDFHATGICPCTPGDGQPATTCDFGVKREGNGSGMVTVTRAGGGQRVIFFEKGHAIGYDRSAADPGEFQATKDADLSIIHIGGERYEIRDAVLYGG
ncbi:MAG: hypothetical protein AB7V59_15520 [Gammaproteobacteria bacterium]